MVGWYYAQSQPEAKRIKGANLFIVDIMDCRYAQTEAGWLAPVVTSAKPQGVCNTILSRAATLTLAPGANPSSSRRLHVAGSLPAGNGTREHVQGHIV